MEISTLQLTSTEVVELARQAARQEVEAFLNRLPVEKVDWSKPVTFQELSEFTGKPVSSLRTEDFHGRIPGRFKRNGRVYFDRRTVYRHFSIEGTDIPATQDDYSPEPSSRRGRKPAFEA